MSRRGEAGFSLLELLVGITLLLVTLSLALGILVEDMRINRQQQQVAAAQAAARNCLSMIEQKLRTAGWDPTLAGIPVAEFDSDPTDGIDEIEVFADLDADGTTSQDGERVRIRHVEDRIEWRTMPGGLYVLLADDITNDADGDGVPEPMFVPQVGSEATSVRVTITAEIPGTGAEDEPFRYTVSSDVLLRKTL